MPPARRFPRRAFPRKAQLLNFNLTSYTDPLNHETRLDYDEAGNLVSVTDPLNHTVNAAYDSEGRVSSVTTALGKTTQLVYEQGDLSSVIDPLNRTSTILTDAAGRTIGVRDPAGNRSGYELDPLDRVLRSIDPRGGVTVMTYDEIGNMLSVRDARDLASHVFTYDALNRVETYTDPLGATESYDYDSGGNLISATDRKGQVTSYAYDALDRLRTITYADSSIITIVWDAGNRPRQFIDSANGTITQDYDGLDRLTREVSPQGQVDYEYDVAGRRTEMTVAGRDPVTYDYDDANRLTQIAHNGISVGLTYDAANRRSTVTLPNGIVGAYAFDDADQLLSINYDLGPTRVGEVTYAYDAAGRRVGQGGTLARMHMPETVGTAIYDTANRLTTWGSGSLTYDDNGNLTSLGAARYEWNVRDQLLSTSNGMSGYAYDVFGRRTSRSVAGATVSYLHDGSNPAVVNNNFLLDGFGLDEVYAHLSPSGTTSYLTNASNDTRSLTDSDGNVVANYSYTPYGHASKTGTEDTSFQFTGRENDGAANLYYYRARYYHPSLGRFISEDPIRLQGGSNLYAYVGGDPVNYSDPTGEVAWIAAGALVGAAVNVGITYVANRGDVTGRQIVAALVSGAISGAAGAVAGPLGGSLARGVGLVSSGYGASAATGVLSAAGSALGQQTANLIDPCNATNPLNAAVWGGIGGAVAKKFFPTKNLNTWAQAMQFGPTTFAGLFGSANAWLNIGSFATSSGVGAAANFPAINPFP